ncbi:MAG TPA: hypothetical protein VGK67_23670 [Myxococcales bacterium]|jgi:hypothetical protein
MKRSVLAVTMLLAGAMVATTFGACGGNNSGGADAGKRDGSVGPPAGKDAEGGCNPGCSGKTPDCNSGTCECNTSSCGANETCTGGACVAKDLCAGSSCGTGEPCDPADGLCKCTKTPESCAAPLICGASLRCVDSSKPCATKECTGTTPVCNDGSGAAVCECSTNSCGAGSSCVSGACKVNTSTADGGVSPPVEATVPQINDPEAAGHAAFATYPANKVHFKAVVVSPIFRDFKKGDGTDATAWYCRMGIYLADATAAVPEHNGVLLLSKSTVVAKADGTAGDCAQDSPLEALQATGGPLEIGEEIEVTGFFKEDCWKTDSKVCDNKDQGGKELGRAVVEQNYKTGNFLVRTGNKPGLPANLPATVKVADIAATGLTGTAPNVTVQVGAKWHDYRQVLVKIVNAEETIDAATLKVSCNFVIKDQGGTVTMPVQDDVMFAGTSCPNDPGMGNLASITGLQAWFSTSTKAETQLAPRGPTDWVK